MHVICVCVCVCACICVCLCAGILRAGAVVVSASAPVVVSGLVVKKRNSVVSADVIVSVVFVAG